MSQHPNNTNNENLIKEMIKAKPKIKKSIEQQDSESLNTMDYYKEDSSNKNSLIDEAKANNNLLYNPNETEKSDVTYQLDKINNDKKSNICKAKRKYSIQTANPKLNQKINNDIKNKCFRCNSDLLSSFRICIKCKKFYCKKCFRGNLDININYNNNIEQENYCQFCKNVKKNNFNDKKIEPLDNYSEDEMMLINDIKNNNNKIKSGDKIKSLKEQFYEYEEFLNKINDKKNEIEIKKNISMNILELIKKAIELEYNRNMDKLNELSIKLNKIKEDINKKINNKNNKYENEVELQIKIDTYKNTINGFSKILDNYNQKIFSRNIFRGYKLYESNNILINYSETYFMQNKEILSDLPFGNVYLKIDRCTNNFINYLNFSTIIIQKNIINNNNQNETNNKSRFIVNMIANNKVIRLNKNNKDKNDINLYFESSEEEKKIFFSKDKNINNNKNKDFNVKIIISEIIL